MKSVIYLVLVLITTSCSTINYFGNGKLKKVRVGKSNKITQVCDQVESQDSLLGNFNVHEIQTINPVLLKEVPNKSSKASVQQVHDQYLNEKIPSYPKQSKNSSDFHERLRTSTVIDKSTCRIDKREKSQNKRAVSGFEEVGKALLMALITIGGILFLLLLIWVFTTFTEIALLVLGYILLVAMIVFVIGFPILVIIALIRGDSVEGKWFTLWLSVLGAILGGVALSKK